MHTVVSKNYGGYYDVVTIILTTELMCQKPVCSNEKALNTVTKYNEKQSDTSLPAVKLYKCCACKQQKQTLQNLLRRVRKVRGFVDEVTPCDRSLQTGGTYNGENAYINS